MSHFCNQRKILFSKDNHTFCGNGFWFWMVRIIIFGGHGFKFVDFLRNRIIISSGDGFWWVSAAVHYLATRFPNPFLCQPRYMEDRHIFTFGTQHTMKWGLFEWVPVDWEWFDSFQPWIRDNLLFPIRSSVSQVIMEDRHICVYFEWDTNNTMKWGLFEWVPVDWVWFDAYIWDNLLLSIYIVYTEYTKYTKNTGGNFFRNGWAAADNNSSDKLEEKLVIRSSRRE